MVDLEVYLKTILVFYFKFHYNNTLKMLVMTKVILIDAISFFLGTSALISFALEINVFINNIKNEVFTKFSFNPYFLCP